jgi:hypothetical protein
MVHWWYYSTSVSEVMYALNDLVVSGKVIYLWVSDTPAWIVSKANEFARSHHGNFKTQAQRDSGEGRKIMAASEKQLKLSEDLEGIGKKKGVPLASKLSYSFDPWQLFSSFATSKILLGR